MATTETETTQKSSTTTNSCVLLNYDIVIPMHIRTLADFRQWAHSNDFPESGRIDFLGNHIEVDMSPEDLFSHGTPKLEIARVIANLVKEQDLGHTFIDSTMISSPVAGLSAEPDVVFLSHQTLDADTARLIPKASGAEGRFVEIEGAVDLVVEIVSDSSVTKDTRRLPPLYFQAGVRELWLVDARGEELRFHIHHRGESEFQPVAVDEEGFQPSGVFQRRYRLVRLTSSRGHWKYDLQEAE